MSPSLPLLMMQFGSPKDTGQPATPAPERAGDRRLDAEGLVCLLARRGAAREQATIEKIAAA
jgi:hypothetical protein